VDNLNNMNNLDNMNGRDRKRTLGDASGAAPGDAPKSVMCPRISARISEIPEEVFPSVAGEVMHCLEVRERRLATLRWGVAVATAALAGIIVNALGARLFEFAYNVITRGVSSTGAFVAYTKLAAIVRLVGETLARKLFEGSIGTDLSPYRVEAWAMAVGAVAAVVFMMYLLGLWLRQPKGVRSWHSRSLWHNVI
jgi:hypothetical protein